MVADYSKKKKTGRDQDNFWRTEKESRKRERCGIEGMKRKEEGLCVKERQRGKRKSLMCFPLQSGHSGRMLDPKLAPLLERG